MSEPYFPPDVKQLLEKQLGHSEYVSWQFLWSPENNPGIFLEWELNGVRHGWSWGWAIKDEDGTWRWGMWITLYAIQTDGRVVTDLRDEYKWLFEPTKALLLDQEFDLEELELAEEMMR